MSRTNKKHLEYIMVPEGNVALATGTLSTAGTAVNLVDRGLGVLVATHDANLPGLGYGDFLPASTSALDVDAVQLVLGTPYSTNTSQVDGWDIKKAYEKGPVMHRNRIRTFSAKLCKTPTYSSQTFSGFNSTTPEDLSLYTMYVESRSVRNDRDYGRAVDAHPVTFTTPDYALFPLITQPLSHLLQNMLHRLNLASKAISTSPSYISKGNKPFIGFGINIAGGAGQALGTITCGTVITVMTTTNNGTPLNSTFVADEAFVQSVNDWINTTGSVLTVASTIETIDLSTAGLAGGVDIDAMVVMGLDHEVSQSYDDIYSTKVRVDVEIGEGFLLGPDYTKIITSRAFDGFGSGREWRIRYDERAFGLEYNMQLRGDSDQFIRIDDRIDEAKSYNAFIIDVWEDDDSFLTRSQQAQKRIVLLLGCTCTCVEAGVLGSFDVVDLAPSDGDTITLGSIVFENDSAVNGVAGTNTGYDGTAADFATTVEATITGTVASVSGNVVTITNCVNDQPTTVTGLNAQLGYWLDSARGFGNAFNINVDSGVIAPDGSSDPSGMDLGTGVYFV